MLWSKFKLDLVLSLKSYINLGAENMQIHSLSCLMDKAEA